MPEPWFASTLDGMTPISNIGVSSAAGYRGATADRAIGPFQSGGQGATSPVLPVRTSGSAGFALAAGNNGTDRMSVTYKADDGSNRIRVATIAAGQAAFQYWDGSAWVTVGSVFDPGVTLNLYRIEWSGYGTSSGSLSMRAVVEAGEAPVATRSASGLDFTSFSGIAQVEIFCTVRGGGNQPGASTFFIVDSDGDASYVYNNVANANGADTGGTGDFNSVNSTGSTYDATFISLPTAGLRRSIKNTANRNYNGRTVRAVAVNARLRRGTTGPTRAAVYLTIGGTRYFHPTVQLLTTSFESYTFVWETNPATGLAWDLADAQAASVEWGVEARA